MLSAARARIEQLYPIKNRDGFSEYKNFERELISGCCTQIYCWTYYIISCLKDLAEQVGIANINLSKIKTGKVSAIRFSTLNAICEALDCQPGDILEYVKNDNDLKWYFLYFKWIEKDLDLIIYHKSFFHTHKSITPFWVWKKQSIV